MKGCGAYLGLASSSGAAGRMGLLSARGEGEFGLSLSPEKSALRSSGLFLPPPLARLAQDRS